MEYDINMKGVQTYWVQDIHRLKTKLSEIKITISRVSMNPLIKRDLINNVLKFRWELHLNFQSRFLIKMPKRHRY